MSAFIHFHMYLMQLYVISQANIKLKKPSGQLSLKTSVASTISSSTCKNLKTQAYATKQLTAVQIRMAQIPCISTNGITIPQIMPIICLAMYRIFATYYFVNSLSRVNAFLNSSMLDIAIWIVDLILIYIFIHLNQSQFNMDFPEKDATFYFTAKCFDECVDSFKHKLLTPVEKDCYKQCLNNVRALHVEFTNGKIKYQQFWEESQLQK